MSRAPGPRRPGANGPAGGGYTNGYGGLGGYGANDDNNPGRPSGERSRDRRPGGYGGFGSSPEPDQKTGGYGGYGGLAVPREDVPTRDARRGDGGEITRTRSRPEAGPYGPGSQQMEEILSYIHSKFDFMTNEKCVPIEVALKLMDSSSLGLADQIDEFEGAHHDLQRALKVIVNEHHQGFNSSIGTFHKIQSSLQTSQGRVRSLKESLTQAKSQLATTKPELREFATTSQNYDEMIQMLSVIEQLQLVPDKLEARISEKRFLSAVDILQDALRLIRKSEMNDIGALSDLRIYLSNQEHSLTDILVEELHNHLYLKSPYCENRWKAYAQNQQRGDVSQRAQADVRGRMLYHFLEKLDTSEPMSDDSARNPEADTFTYIQLLVESLNKMNRLEQAVDTIEHRLPIELFKVVEKSNNEVAQRHPVVLGTAAKQKNNKFHKGADNDELRTGLLNDLLWTLYARFEAIAEGHRVVHDVVSGIVRREGLRDTLLTRGFKGLWELYQSEMRSLLHDYLASRGDLGYGEGQRETGSGSAFSLAPRDKNKRMFRLADMNLKSPDLTTEREDLEFILKSSVPGLVSDAKRPDDLNETNSSTLDGSATGHKLLVEPSVFNMGILLPPSLDFLNRLKEVVPSGSEIVMSTLTSFLDDFLVNVFHPQLDETLVEMSAHTFIDVDAFQQEPQWAKHSKKPIFKGTAKFFTIITAFCKMLDNLPHDQAFSQLIITQMEIYADKCKGWFKALVSRPHPSEKTGRMTKAPAALAEASALRHVITALLQSPDRKETELYEKEVEIILERIKTDPIDEADLIEDRKSIANLCLLYTSMKWLATKVAQLRHISDRATDSSRPEPGNIRHNRRWTLLSSTEPRTEGLPVYLPLNEEAATSFDTVLLTYTTLSTTVLHTLHFTLRTSILHSLAQSIFPSYILDSHMGEPDPATLALNSTLVAIDEEIQALIPSSQYPFIVKGLGTCMDIGFLNLVCDRVKKCNEEGARHVQLNILVLQQSLKNIEPEAKLENAALWFDLFLGGAEAIVERAKREGSGFGVQGVAARWFGVEGLRGLVEVCFAEGMGSPRREVSLRAKEECEGMLESINEAMG